MVNDGVVARREGYGYIPSSIRLKDRQSSNELRSIAGYSGISGGNVQIEVVKTCDEGR